jgi:hypothetical protein
MKDTSANTPDTNSIAAIIMPIFEPVESPLDLEGDSLLGTVGIGVRVIRSVNDGFTVEVTDIESLGLEVKEDVVEVDREIKVDLEEVVEKADVEVGRETDEEAVGRDVVGN